MPEPPSLRADDAATPVFVTPRAAHNNSILLAPYDPLWPEVFAAVGARIEAALGRAAFAIHHVGSTSVPGLSAKPIIDVVLEVADPADEAAYVPGLTEAGFQLHIREPDWFEHRLLRGAAPAVNLHVFAGGCEEVARMLAFRDWLRGHDDDRRLYEETKQRLAANTWAYVQDYADAKTEVVREILGRAR
jgi:GrpB-like predicted nucleotidyltransferase (UPF0157 family)